MARDFNPNNLSAGDVLRILASSIALIFVLLIAVLFVSRFAPDFTRLFIGLLGIGVFVVITRLPKKDLAAISEKEHELEEKIGRIPIIGSVAKPAWRSFNWLTVILGVIVLILLVLASVMNLV